MSAEDVIKNITSGFLPIRASYSCEHCRQTTYSAYQFSKMKFCNYRCAFRYVWRIVYGWHEKITWTNLNEVVTIEPGWSDAQIQSWADVQVKGKFSRKDSAFLLVRGAIK